MATGYTTPVATTNVASIAISNDGLDVITITYQATAGGGTVLLTPTLTANGDVTWACTVGTQLTKYVPASCRG